MSTNNTGGPAFPTARVNMQGEVVPDEEGMTLRDYFAAKAMQGIVSSIDGEDNYLRLHNYASHEDLTVSEWIARDAYKQADAMIRAREAK